MTMNTMTSVISFLQQRSSGHRKTWYEIFRLRNQKIMVRVIKNLHGLLTQLMTSEFPQYCHSPYLIFKASIFYHRWLQNTVQHSRNSQFIKSLRQNKHLFNRNVFCFPSPVCVESLVKLYYVEKWIENYRNHLREWKIKVNFLEVS